MNFAVIGSNPAAMVLLRQLQDSDSHHLKACLPEGDLLDRLTNSGFSVPVIDSAEHLLPEKDLQVLVLAVQDCDEIVRLTRAAVQAEKHVVVVLPDQGVYPALAFELQLIQDESQMSVIPVSGRWRLAEIPDGQTGLQLVPSDVRQISLVQNLASNEDDAVHVAARQGIDLLCALGFTYSQVTVLDSPLPDGTLLRRLITLGTLPDAELRLPPAALTLNVEPGSNADGDDVLCVVNSAGEQQRYSLTEPDFLRWVTEGCRDREVARTMMGQCSVTLELMEAAAKSLRRRRTVDVHFDSGSERSLFKSQMTAIGCLVLFWLLGGMLTWLIVGQLIKLPKWFWLIARLIWLAPMVFFLLAQLLLPLARDRQRN